MLDKFNHFILTNDLIPPNNSVLLAVSGGLDSMCMLDLFRKSEFAFGIAHLNHGMRGESSEKDEKLVEEYASKYNIPFFVTKLNLKNIQSNFQAEARKIRYNWLLEIANKNNFQLIATAHHQDDQVENFFLRIKRNAGLNGMSGIKIKSGIIIRPLMFCYKSEIQDYITTESIQYREDESNSESKYERNFFRNEIISKIVERHPQFKENISSTIAKISESQDFINHTISEIEKACLLVENEATKIDLTKIVAYPSPGFILFQILEKYGINRTQSDNLLSSRTGGEILTPNKIFLKNRDEIIIRKKETMPYNEFHINKLEGKYVLDSGQTLCFTSINDFEIPRDANSIVINSENIKMPLTVRKKLPGDYFFPFGMEMQKKKVKKFLIDIKLSLFEKENMNILVDAEDKIIWLIGLRMDETFKITDRTSNYTKIEITS